MSLIVDQYGRPYKDAKTVKPREFLAVAPINDSFRDYVADGLSPEKLAAIFRQADGGDMRSQAELFETIEERDAHVLCERDKRRNAIIDLDSKVEPATDDQRDLKVAEFVEAAIVALDDWDDSLVVLQDAVGKGYSSMELRWDNSEGGSQIVDMPVIPQRRFLFHDEKGVPTRIPRLITDREMMGEDIPPFASITHIYGGKTGSPTRSAIYRVCAWMTLFKTYSIKDWAIFSEIYGMPLRIGKYESGANDDDKRALRSAISSIGSDAAGIISKNTEIEFIETTKGATAADLWEKLASFCNRENSKALLGQNLSAEVQGGSFAASKTHNEVRLDLLRADARAIASTIRRQLIKPLVGYNFGFDTPLPKFKLIYKEGEDLKVKSEWIGNLLKEGVSMPRSFINTSFGIPKAENGEEMIGGPAATPAKTTTLAAKNNPAEPHPHEQVFENLASQVPTVDDFCSVTKKLLVECTDLEEYRERLIETFAAMDITEMAAEIQRALTAAELAGHFDAINEES